MLFTSPWFGATMPESNVYGVDIENGANLMTISVGHSLDTLCYVVGELHGVQATLANNRPEVTVTDAAGNPKRTVKKTSHDHCSVIGTLPGGGVATAICQGGMSAVDKNFFCEITGTKGTLLLEGPMGNVQGFPPTIKFIDAKPEAKPQPIEVPRATDPNAFKAFGEVVSRVEQLSGTAKTFTSLYSTISEAQTEEAMNALEILTDVSKAGDEFAKQVRQTLDKFTKQIFDGSYLSTRRLYPMIADGTWLDAPKNIEPIMNAMLINKAWTTGANGNAIVILVKEGHVTYPQPRRGNAALMTNDDGEATQHFYTNFCTQNRCYRRFKAPKGLDEIRKENDYGVTLENMILSPFFNWRRQGNQNSHPTKLDPYAKNGDKSSSQVPFSVGLNHPGAIPIPACDIESAWQNIAEWWRDPSEAPCDYYPCCSY
ncbi:transcription regulator gal80 [Fusarium falciforme]|nr:transcription regulator gal80 [Fusarium falciforme]